MIAYKILMEIILKAISSAVGFISIILVAKAFLPQEIGGVIFIIGICSLASMFFDFGFNQTANTRIAQEKLNPQSVIGTLIYIKLLLSILYLGVLLIVFLVNHEKISTIGFGIFAIIATALFIEAFAISLQQFFVGKRFFYKYMINNFIAQLISSIFLIIIAVYFPTTFNYSLATFIKSLCLILVVLYQLKSFKIDWKIKKEVFQDFWRYTKPSIVMVPLFSLIAQAETILLPYLISNFALGIFAFGLKLYNIAEMAAKTFTSYIYTYVCNIIAKFDQKTMLEKLNNLFIGTQVFSTILVIGLINRSDFLTLLAFGKEYAAASIVTKLMCVFLYISTVSSNYSHIIYAKEAHKKLINLTIIGGLVLILSSIILIPQALFGLKLFGLEYAGMPLAKIIRLILPGIFVAIIITQKLIKKAFIKTQLKFIILAIFYLIFDNYLLNQAGNNIIWVFISWFLGVLLYLTIVFYFFTDKQCKAEIKNIISLKKMKESLIEI